MPPSLLRKLLGHVVPLMDFVGSPQQDVGQDDLGRPLEGVGQSFGFFKHHYQCLCHFVFY